MQTLVSRYLFTYRNTIHCSTGQTPANLMLGRDPKTRLDFLTKSQANKIRSKQIDYYRGSREVSFEEGEICYARDYRNVNKPCWKKVIVNKKLGDRTYICNPVSESYLSWKRHVNQLIRVGHFFEDEYEKIIEQRESLEPEREQLREIPPQESMQKGGLEQNFEEGAEVAREVPVSENTQREAQPVSLPVDVKLECKENPQNQRSIAIDRPRRQVKPPERLDL